MADVEKGTSSEDGHLDQPPSQEGCRFGDSSGPLFSMYSKIVEKDDNALAERWQKDADGIIIFAGLFSAVISTFLSISIPDLRANSQDISAFYLKNIYQYLADPNVSVPTTLPTVATPPTFSPPKYAITVNIIWVLCLCTNLACGMMGIMLQQWARQYVKFTQPPRRSPRRQARTRALFAGSVDRLSIRTLSYLLPCLLHFSALFFAVGLLVFFHGINSTIFIHMLWFFCASGAIYTFLTVLPLFQSDSLLYTPVSTLPTSLVALSTCLVHSTFADRFKFKTWSVLEWLFEDVSDTVKNMSSKRSPEIDVRILELTLNFLSEDAAMEEFFGSIPDFFSSKWVDLLPTDLPAELQNVFKEALYEFLDNTFRSTTVAESLKNSRLIICLDASRAALGLNGPSWILYNILNGNWPELLRSVEMGHLLTSWVHSNDEENVLYIRSIVSHIVASVEKRDDSWLALVTNQPGLSEDLLRQYPPHGDSVLLANLINITRLTFRSQLPNWKFHMFPFKCDVSSTLPSLQHDFCSLWNEIVSEARNSKSPASILILKNIRPVYVALHPETGGSPMAFSATTVDTDILDQPSSYPLCNIASHRPDTTHHDHNETIEDVSLGIHSCVQSVPDGPHHGLILASGTRPFDMPAHYTTRNPSDELSLGSVSDAPRPGTPVIPSPLLDSQPAPTSLYAAAADAKQGSTDISAVPFMANYCPHPISSSDFASEPQQSKSVIPSSIVNDVNLNARPIVLPSSANSAVTQSGYLYYEQGFSSQPLPTAHPHISPQVRSDLEAHITTRTRTLRARNDALDLDVPNSMRVLPHPSISASSTPDMSKDMSSNTLQPGDSQQGLNQSRPWFSDGNDTE